MSQIMAILLGASLITALGMSDPDHSLHLAMERLGESKFDLLPVVSRADLHQLEGVLLLHDVLDSYGIGG
jgi:CBS domain-containing protein